MLTFSSQQLDTVAESRFQQRLRDFMLESLPDSRGVIDTPEGKKNIAAQCAKARSYGMIIELDIANYIITAWLLGLDFDTRLPAMKEILATPDLTPSQKAALISQVSSLLLDELEKGNR